ncbi:MAG: competence protein [Legionellaceae bacterium]|nr:competence protein [Legionellaceae bacterium]HAF87543.1 competence protein [Legionellales bacterium]HCA89945.1 competence protein [Legionellales bacterium]|tara:strand:+ start:832 stop:1161 length:330 start_codon:yes stop_codon:yes gene_type:complete
MTTRVFTYILFLMSATTSLFAADVPPKINMQPAPPLINLNSASGSSLLHAVKGIGLKRAQAIIHYREHNRAFTSVGDLALVPGIGKKFVQSHWQELQKTFTAEPIKKIT